MRRCHLTIESWMIDFFNLNGDELIVYAIIYGFSQDGKSMYMGSRDYLTKWCSGSLRTIQRILNKLVKDKLIIKYTIIGQKTKGYRVNLDKITECIKNEEVHNKTFQSSIDEENKTINHFI